MKSAIHFQGVHLCFRNFGTLSVWKYSLVARPLPLVHISTVHILTAYCMRKLGKAWEVCHMHSDVTMIGRYTRREEESQCLVNILLKNLH